MLNRTVNSKRAAQRQTWLCLELDRIGYGDAHELQLDLVDARKRGALRRDILLVLEHPPVFTLGRRGGLENLLVSRTFLSESGIDVVQAERGGNITYHGPGQLVAYPICDLQSLHLSVTDFVYRLEEIMIRTCGDWGIRGSRNPLNRGAWVGNNKLGSVGIAVRKGISYHGLALNAVTSLEPYGWINPCGLQHVGVTSMQMETDRTVEMEEVRRSFKRYFSEVFDISLEPVTAESLGVVQRASNLETDSVHHRQSPLKP